MIDTIFVTIHILNENGIIILCYEYNVHGVHHVHILTVYPMYQVQIHCVSYTYGVTDACIMRIQRIF